MQRTRITDVLTGKHPLESEVTLQGWVRTRRDSKAGLSFINLHDGSCFDPIQIVAGSQLENYAEEIQRLSAGCSIRVTGQIVASQGKGQSVELQAISIEIIGWVDDPETYPMQPKRHSMEFLREMAHLRPRTNLIGAAARVRNSLSQAIHRFFHERGFLWVHTPIITGADAEGAGDQFRVSTLDLMNLPLTDGGQVDFSQDFFGKETHLTVSGQLNVETYCLALGDVYTFGPTFRAENSNTRRHLAEFWMVEPEIAFADLSDDIDLAEAFLKYIFTALLEERSDDMEFFEKRIEKTCIERLRTLIDSDFARLDYTKAIEVLEKAPVSFEFPVSWGIDLQAEHERYLSEQYINGPVAVINYPKDIKAFYMRLNDDGRTVAAMDVLAPGVGELIGGSQREDRLDVLDSRIRDMGMEPEEYGWYRDLRKYGSVPHAGFGLGFERAMMYATGVDNIREIIPFPRSRRNASF